MTHQPKSALHEALEALHQNRKLVTGQYDYQCGFLDCLQLAKEIAALQNQAVTPHGDDASNMAPPETLQSLFDRTYSDYMRGFKDGQSAIQPAPLHDAGEKTLAQELREESDRLSFKMKNNSIRGKVFTMEEAQKLHVDRERELAALKPVSEDAGKEG